MSASLDFRSAALSGGSPGVSVKPSGCYLRLIVELWMEESGLIQLKGVWGGNNEKGKSCGIDFTECVCP